MFSKSELVDLYLSQQSELYGNNLHLNKNQVQDCLQCNGDLNSDLVFINQGSYKKDDLDYFNKSNQLLKKILSAISLSYENVFITRYVLNTSRVTHILTTYCFSVTIICDT